MMQALKIKFTNLPVLFTFSTIIQKEILDTIIFILHSEIEHIIIHSLSIDIIVHYLSAKRTSVIVIENLKKMAKISDSNQLFFSFFKVTENKLYLVFNKHIRSQLSDSKVFKVTEQLVKKRFNSKHTLLLYEFLLYFQSYGKTPKISCEQLQVLMGANKNFYQKFNNFNALVQNSLKEIKSKSSLNISCVLKDKNNNKASIYFIINQKVKNYKLISAQIISDI